MSYFRQLYYDMRHQKMMTWVSISGTALSIFLVMVFFMSENVKTVEVRPETNRNRILTACYLDVVYKETHRHRTGALSKDVAERLYSNLDGIEQEAYAGGYISSVDVNLGGRKSSRFIKKIVGADFWKIFDFDFISGRPYDEGACESEQKVAVITRFVARKLFDTDDAVGMELNIDNVPYKICGVIDDVPPMLKSTFGHIYTPLGPFVSNFDNDMLGQMEVYLLMKAGVKKEYIRDQVKERYARYNMELEKDSIEIIYHGSPYDSEVISSPGVLNPGADPDLASDHRDVVLIYLILVLLPAINLSCMTRSRLAHRVSEIGVRRAFGAKRKRIIAQILGENFLITLLGGLIGLGLSFIFMKSASSLFFPFMEEMNTYSLELLYATPSFSMLFTWKSFFFGLCVCFLLNLLSAMRPAWRASRVVPAVAIDNSKI